MAYFKEGRISPYATSLGSMIKTDKLEKDLKTYAAVIGEPLNYGYVLEDYNLYFILGLNEDEKNIQPFNHPFFFLDSKLRKCIAADLRPYTGGDISKKNYMPEDIVLKDVMKNPVDAGFVVNRALISGCVANDNLGYIRNSFKALTVTYALLVGTVINNIINLGVKERLTVEVVAAYYFYSQLTATHNYEEDELKEILSNQLDRVKLNIVITKQQVSEFLTGVGKMTTFNDLINMIKHVLPEAQASLIDARVFTNMISNMWFGPGGSELLPISMEHPGTWLTIFYYSLEELTYKRTRIMEMIKKFGLKTLSANSGVEFNQLLKSCNPLG